ncbi:hypothetical protein F5880DRAFT_1523828 [Lentinula raphanica]|nr:hypothetical protein F5880DRAFT_1523828 [Lentinula raphanica]
MLLSMSSSVPSRLSSILWLALCLHSITAVARPIQVNQVDDGPSTTALSNKLGGYEVPVYLRRYTYHGKSLGLVTLCVNFTASAKIIKRRDTRIEGVYVMTEEQIGFFRFEDEKQAKKSILEAERSATETQSSPDWAEWVDWKYLDDFVLYMSFCRAVDEETWGKWKEVRPESINVANTDGWIALIVYRTAASHSIMTEQVSVRVDGKLDIPPQRRKPITSRSAVYVTIVKLQDNVRIDYEALHKHAAEHATFIDDEPAEGVKWLSDFEEIKKSMNVEGSASAPGRVLKKLDFDEWLRADGLMDGLWEQRAIDPHFRKSDWVKQRNEYVDSWVKIRDYQRKYARSTKRKHSESIDKRRPAMELQSSPFATIAIESIHSNDIEETDSVVDISQGRSCQS